MNQTPAVSFIYPYRNKETDRVENSLQSLVSQPKELNTEIILVDYGSEPEYSRQIKKLIDEKFPLVQYLHSETRGMPWNRSHALNTGIRAASGDFIFTCDVDILFRPDFTFKLKEWTGHTQACFFSVAYLPRGITRWNESELNNLPKSDRSGLGLGLIKKSILHAIGGYDEFYRVWGWEDNDLGHRIRLAGNEWSFMDEVYLLHQWHEPAKNTMPAGWHTCMTDYFEMMKGVVLRNKEKPWGLRYTADSRKSFAAFYNEKNAPKRISCREKFFDVFLTRQLNSMPSGATVFFEFFDMESDKYIPARSAKAARMLNCLFRKSGLSVEAFSQNRNMYFTSAQAHDALFYFVVANEHRLEDYYIDQPRLKTFRFAFSKI